MNKKIACFISVGALVINLLAIALENRMAEMISKPLIIAGLFAWLLFVIPVSSTLRSLSLAALAFSWMGDVLLLFQYYRSLFFLLGLSSFLLAHILYCIIFSRIRIQDKISLKMLWLLPSLAFYIAIMTLLNDSLADMTWPVRIYGLVITVMLFLALQLSGSSDKHTGQLINAGAVLFVVSDSLLAINKFYQPLPYAGIGIMLTYGLAQWCLTRGIARHLAGGTSR